MRVAYFTNLLLIVIIISLLWFLLDEKESGKEKTVFNQISANDIQHIIVEKAGVKSVELFKQDSLWSIDFPFKAAANPARVNLIMSLLEMTPHAMYLHNQNANDLQKFGLFQPLVTLHLNDHRFQFGDLDPIKQYRYVMYQNTLYLFDDMVMPLLMANAESLIENSLFTKDKEIIKIVLPTLKEDALTKETATLTNEQGQLKSDLDLSKDMILKLLDNWQHAKAMQVKLDDDAKTTDLAINVWFKNQTAPKRFNIQIEENKFKLTSPDNTVSYILPIDMLKQLFPSVSP